MESMYKYDSPAGPLSIVDNGRAICGIYFSKNPEPDLEPKHSRPLRHEQTELQRRASEQLNEYFAGQRTRFDLPLEPQGTEFQLKVWRELAKIPYGETRTYKQMAEAAGSPQGFRAAGLANNRNPISIVLPCHRVIGSNGSLTGFGGGLDVKARLLKMELLVAGGFTASYESARG